MKKEFLIGIVGIIVVVLFITSCVPQKVYVCPDGSQVLNANNCRIAKEEELEDTPVDEEIEEQEQEQEEVEEIEEVEEEEEEPEPEEQIPVDKDLSEEAQALFDKSAKVNNIRYYFVPTPDFLPEDLYYATREKMRITLETKVRFTQDDSYDTIYLNSVGKTAVAYCEDRDNDVCPDWDKTFDVEYKDYYIDTPFVWIDMIATAELTGRTKRINMRNAVEASFTRNGYPGTMFADSFFGVPMEVTYRGETIEFREMIINQQIDEDFTHQPK